MIAVLNIPDYVAATSLTPLSKEANPAEASSGIDLSSQPVYEERSQTMGENQINEKYVLTTFIANGTLNLPNSTENITTTSTGNALVSLADSTVIGEQVITTEDKSENATAKFFGVARFNMGEETGRGLVIAVVHTDSTGALAPLNGMILAGHGEFASDATSSLTLWEWESGLPLPSDILTTEESPLMNDTATVTTNVTTAAFDTNATATGIGRVISMRRM